MLHGGGSTTEPQQDGLAACSRRPGPDAPHDRAHLSNVVRGGVVAAAAIAARRREGQGAVRALGEAVLVHGGCRAGRARASSGRVRCLGVRAPRWLVRRQGCKAKGTAGTAYSRTAAAVPAGTMLTHVHLQAKDGKHPQHKQRCYNNVGEHGQGPQDSQHAGLQAVGGRKTA